MPPLVMAEELALPWLPHTVVFLCFLWVDMIVALPTCLPNDV